MLKTWCKTLKKDLEPNDAVIIPLSGGECSNRATRDHVIHVIQVRVTSRGHHGDAAKPLASFFSIIFVFFVLYLYYPHWDDKA